MKPKQVWNFDRNEILNRRFSCEQNLPEAKLIRADSLNIVLNEHVRLKVIAGAISLRSF